MEIISRYIIQVGDPTASLGWGDVTSYGLLLFLLVLLSIRDWRERLLPDSLTFTLAASGIAISILKGRDPVAAVEGAMILGGIALTCWAGGTLVFSRFDDVEDDVVLGLGDVKMLAAAGAWLEPRLLPSFGITLVCTFAAMTWLPAKVTSRGTPGGLAIAFATAAVAGLTLISGGE
ncbi:A24 family peptidase [Azospirillum sp. B4]|uniref:prepilin peptidase n=1 Tax=Azospirillum sp. B4 TaxID=95605 RepID=UPI0005CA5D8F|nr:A24 family peptidase [Azospirillum sp. B4]